jgi:manganese/zinc/iron transport system permease protein
MDKLAFWTIVAGILSGTSCALLGCYLVLRRMSLLGDAISHAVLPGIVIAVLWSGQLAGWQVFVGAVLVGLLTAFLTQALASMGNVPEDSSMGVVYTSLFALGVILITQFASQVDLDPGCVLYGQIEYLPLNRFKWAGWEIPWEILPLVAVTLATGIFITILWKELKLVAFDAALATAMGISAVAVHYLLMGMVAVVTVASFKSVGSILVIAMLIVPPATAHLLTDRLWTMQLWAVACAVISAVVGYQAAAAWNTSVAGMMAVVSGVLFFIAVIFAPQHGLLTQVIRTLRLTLRIVREDILAVLYRVEERGRRDGHPTTLGIDECVLFAGGGFWPKLAIPLLKSRGLIEEAGKGQLALTEIGRRKAESLVRSHRLWEAYLEKHFELPRDHLHAPASRIEHYLGPNLQEELSQELAAPAQDPHGQDIPPGEPKAEDPTATAV